MLLTPLVGLVMPVAPSGVLATVVLTWKTARWAAICDISLQITLQICSERYNIFLFHNTSHILSTLTAGLAKFYRWANQLIDLHYVFTDLLKRLEKFRRQTDAQDAEPEVSETVQLVDSEKQDSVTDQQLGASASRLINLFALQMFCRTVSCDEQHFLCVCSTVSDTRTTFDLSNSFWAGKP